MKSLEKYNTYLVEKSLLGRIHEIHLKSRYFINAQLKIFSTLEFSFQKKAQLETSTQIEISNVLAAIIIIIHSNKRNKLKMELGQKWRNKKKLIGSMKVCLVHIHTPQSHLSQLLITLVFLLYFKLASYIPICGNGELSGPVGHFHFHFSLII